MLRGDAPREAPPPTVHNTVVSFGSGQFYPADGRIFAALEPPRQTGFCVQHAQQNSSGFL